MSKKTEKVNMADMSMSEKAKIATFLGEEVGKILNAALQKCNKTLKKYGYSVSVTLNFHELEDKDTK